MYSDPCRCSKGHPWCAQIWHGSMRGIQARLAWRRKTKGSAPWQNDEEEAEDVFRYPKEDFCKQHKQRHSTTWHTYICPHGPAWWQRAAISGLAMSLIPTHSGHCRGGSSLEIGQWERRTNLLWPGSLRGTCSSRKHPWAFCYNQWWYESGSGDEGQWPDILSNCWLSTKSYPTWMSQESQNRRGLRYALSRLDLERREIEQWSTTWIQFRNMVPGHQIQQWRKFFSTCLHITNDQWAEAACMQSKQEEAVTRIHFHEAHAAADGYGTFVVTTDGTETGRYSVCDQTVWLECTYTPDVTTRVPSQVVRSSEPWSSWDQSIVRKCFTSWGSPGNHPRTYSRNCKHPHANVTHHTRQQRTTTQPATNFSAHGLGSTSLPSFHHARTASSCIPCALTTILASGYTVSNNIRKSRAT